VYVPNLKPHEQCSKLALDQFFFVANQSNTWQFCPTQKNGLLEQSAVQMGIVFRI
jgi:hypothetical protein